MSMPYEGWAAHYDLVMEETFGVEYAAFTAETLAAVRERVAPPASIVDFGAGTGRLAVPLAREGYAVTAVDASGAMLEELRRKADGLQIREVSESLGTYEAVGDFDLGLCVFTVVVHLLDLDALGAACATIARSVRRGGHLLMDVPTAEVLEGFEIETDRVIRYVEIDRVPDTSERGRTDVSVSPHASASSSERVASNEGASSNEPAFSNEPTQDRTGALYRYRERTAVMSDDGPITYEDSHRIRLWSEDQVLGELRRVGFVVREDLSARFERWGARYFWLERV